MIKETFTFGGVEFKWEYEPIDCSDLTHTCNDGIVVVTKENGVFFGSYMCEFFNSPTPPN
jgi:hypothetical protein